jgi:hypothetical protein
MTRTNEMTNPQARTKHRTTAQVAELCSQSAEDYHQQYLHKVPKRLLPRPQHGCELPGRHPSGLDDTTDTRADTHSLHPLDVGHIGGTSARDLPRSVENCRDLSRRLETTQART